MKKKKVEKIVGSVQFIMDQVEQDEKEKSQVIEQTHEVYRKSAANLINYLSLRSFDIRKLQRKLGYLGMSRLARAEAHVKASLRSTLTILNHLMLTNYQVSARGTLSIKAAEKLMESHTNALLGTTPKTRRLRIMVTMPTEAADDYSLVKNMVSSGMDICRINCAHDDEAVWLKMVNHVKKASKELGREITITMDLGGPKIRTGEIKSRQVKHFQAETDEDGKLLKPVIVRFVTSDKGKQKNKDLPVDQSWLEALSVEDEVRLQDANGEDRALRVVQITEKGVVAHSLEEIYFESGTLLKAKHGETEIGEFTEKKQSLFLRNNDPLRIYKSSRAGRPAKYDDKGNLKEPASLSCSMPAVLEHVKKGDPVFFDDGEIEAVVEEKKADSVLVRIRHAKSGGTKLKSDKGINFPDSNLKINGLTDKDREDLRFVAKHADAVNFSFVNTPQDVADILSELEKLQVKDKLGLILKIETKNGYDHLTKILLEAMKTSKIGVMIARGDLAIETGWERIGSIQKEILAICNAGHVPVVWATQVLENLAKKGLPSRSEITDAVNAAKADCVMLNKGPHILEAIKLLDQIIRSSETYQDKNAPMLPKLKKISQKKKG